MLLNKAKAIEYRATFIYKIMYLLLALFSFNNLTVYTTGLRMAALGVMILGAIIILYRFILSKKYIQSIGAVFLGLFLLSYVFSSILNAQYGVEENIKALVWMTILFGVLYLTDDQRKKESLLKEMRILHIIVLVYITVMNLIGIVMFFLDFGLEFGRNGSGVHYGWLIGRLMGMYSDPNYMAVISCIALLILGYLYVEHNNIHLRVACILSFLINIAYIALSDSRTGLVAFVCTTFAVSFLLLKRHTRFMQLKQWMRVSLSALIALVLLIASFGAIQLVLEGARLYKAEPNTQAYTFQEQPFVASTALTHIDYYLADVTYVTYDSQVTRMPLIVASTTETTDGPAATASDSEVGRDFLNNDFTAGRLDIWGSAWEIFLSSPVYGVSFRNIIPYAQANLPETFVVNNTIENFASMHNIVLDILVSQGVIGIVFFAIFAVIVLKRLFTGLHRAQGSEYVVITIGICTMLPIIISTIFYSEIIYINTSGSVLFWITLGALMRYLIVRDDLQPS